jgi:hypothetical protein
LSEDLIVPVYLNQRFVFDLVAMLQGGIATVTKVSQAEREDSSVSGEAGGSFGLSQALSSLLKIDFSGKTSASGDESTQRTRDEERVHTPASLFFELRRMMVTKQALVQDRGGYAPKPGDFIEFSTSLKRNPLVESLDATMSLMKFYTGITEQPRKSKQTGGQAQPDLKQVQKQMELFSGELRAGNTLDLTTDELQSSYKAVVTLEAQFLNDPTLSDLVEGTFRVAGKVIRVVPKGEGAISLIRKAALSRMPTQVMEQFKQVFNLLSEEHGFSLPKVKWEVDGPVIQVLPIAIYA